RWSCRVEERTRGRFRVHLHGSLHAGWAGRLAAGLAARRITIHRLVAKRSPEMLWDAEVDVEALERVVGLDGFDFLSLTLDHADPQRTGPLPGLSSYALRRTPEDVLVELRAPDAVGFLDAILHLYAFYGMFPHALRIDTRGAEAVDLFRLQTLAGRVPPAKVVVWLERTLDGMVRR
ncbi:MAG TPA: hypothetical protein VD838_12985, partial [Anaeromyxobacteraceae bacterium]|nr:hypothetical protein [Anaeromyxobacteraceae bacterium]